MVEPFGVDRIADHDREIRVIKRMLMDLEERLRVSTGGSDVREQAQLRQEMEAVKQLVDQISSREGVTLHRLETLKERVDEVAALGTEVEELKKRLGSPGSAGVGGGGVDAELLTDLQESVREARQQLELLRANQVAQTKRLDALKEENLKLRSELRQLEAQAHEALEALRQRGERVEKRLAEMERTPPRRAPSVRSNLNALRERVAQLAEISDSGEPGEGSPAPRGRKGKPRAPPDGE